MIRLLADETFNNNIFRGVRLREPGVDLGRVQDLGLSGAKDPTVLELARKGVEKKGSDPEISPE